MSDFANPAGGTFRAILSKLTLLGTLLALPALAAPVDKLQDSFGGTSIDPARWTVTQSKGTASEGGGTLNLLPNANTGSASIQVSSAGTYSLSGSRAAVNAARVPSSAGNVNAQFSLSLDANNYLQWYYEAGFLYAFSSVAGTRTQRVKLSFSAMHAWWRIRESAGVTYWETSSDGAVYSVRASTSSSTLFAQSSLRVNFKVATSGTGLASPGQASFANLNVAPSGISPMASLVDTFAGTSLGPAWTIETQTQGTVTESGGSLNLAPNSNTGSSQLIVSSARPYALTGSAALVNVKQVVSGAGNADNRLELQIDASNSLQWTFQSGTLQAFYTVNGTRTTAGSVPYNAVQHAWWRIREAGGSVYWDTAPDGLNWTARATVSDTALFSLSMLYVRFYAETLGTGSPAPGTAQYANINYLRYFVVSGVPASLTAGVADTVTVEVRDAFGSRATDYTGTLRFSTSDANATIPAPYTFTAADQGIKSFASGLVFRTAGSQTLVATDGGTMTTSSAVTVAPAAASSLSLTGLPATAVAGDSLQATVTAFDPYGNVATGYNGTVHFATSDPQATVPSDGPFLPADLGAHTFCCVSLRSAGTQTVTVSDTLGGISTSSQSVSVTAAPASALRVAGIGATGAGVVLSPVVSAVDSYGNLDASYRGTVHFSSSDPRAVLPADYTFTASDAGSRTFLNALVFKTAGTQTLTYVDTVRPSITGSALASVSPGPAASLVLTTPNAATAGSPFSASLEVLDAYTNRAAGYTGTVSFSSSDTRASLPTSYSFTAADAGFKNFSVSLKTVGTQSIGVGDGVLSVTSGPIQVGPGAAQSLIVSGFPNPASSGVAGSITVEARDGFGNRATGYQGTVQFSSTDSAASLPAATAFAASDQGFKSFSGVILRTAGTQSITAGDGAVTGSQQGIVVNSPFPPTWPSGSTLSATAASNTSAVLTWSAAVDATLGVSGYRVYKDGALVQTVAGSTLSTTVIGLTLGVETRFQVQAGNSAGNWSLDGPATTYVTVPPDPVLIAPPVDRSVPTTLFDSTAFIYTGPDAVQIGVATGTIDQRRAAAVRGSVHVRSGSPLPGARISVKDHAEYGWTLSRSDGNYDLVVNGGGALILTVEHDGFLPLQRQLAAGWNEYSTILDAVMVPYDSAVSLIDTSQTSVVQVARGSISQDTNGPRRATVIFPPGTQATITLPDGTTQTLSSMRVRATEYTVGSNGPAAMPLELPATSAYTYAVAFTVDEAVGANADKVQFSQTVYGYVENFIGLPVGAVVPSGYHDHDKGVWLPQNNGRVVKILDTSSGTATVDVDGTGTAADETRMASLGLSVSERVKLASLYSPGQSLWRVPLDHFSCDDWNMPPLPLEDSRPPNGKPDFAQPEICSPEIFGSIIECLNQTLGQRVRIPGTQYTLNYRSDRVSGRRAAFQITVPLLDAGCWAEPSIPSYVDPVCGAGKILVGSWAVISTAGQTPQYFDGAGTGGVANYEWDGRDRYGRELQGTQEASVKVCNSFPGTTYGTPGGAARAFGLASASGASILVSRSREGLSYDFCRTFKVRLGTFDVQPEGLGAWTMSPHHRYDYAGQIIYLGDGERLAAPQIDNLVANAVAGGGSQCISLGNFYPSQVTVDGQPAYPSCNGGPMSPLQAPNGNLLFLAYAGVRQVLPTGMLQTIVGIPNFPGDSGDEGLATQARIAASLGAISMGPDGSVYVLTDTNRIRKLTPDGIIHAFAGNGQVGNTADGVPAVSAPLNFYRYGVGGLVAAPDGSVYFSEGGGHRVRRVMPDGTLTTVAGTGVAGLSGDQGPATAANLNVPSGLALGPDGTLYIADRCNHRIRKVTPDGRISTVAGSTGPACGYPAGGNFWGDGGLATSAGLHQPDAVAVGPDGTVYIADYLNARIRRVRPSDGMITSVAGQANITTCGGKNCPALQVNIGRPSALSIGADGSLYVAGESANGTVWKINSAYARTGVGEALVASSDGSEVYAFDGAGRHQRTLDAVTSVVLRRFGYDTAGRLTTITERPDTDNLVTTLERDGKGNPTAIVGPYGQRTALALDGHGYLAQIVDPAPQTTVLQYDPPVAGVQHSGGLLTQLTDPRNGIHLFHYGASGFLDSDTSAANATQTLDRHATLYPTQVDQRTPLGRTTTYGLVPSAGGDSVTASVTDPPGFSTSTKRSVDFSSVVTYPDNSTGLQSLSADPRFGMDAPVASSSMRLPSGLTLSTTESRTVTLQIANDPLSLTQLVESVAINGRTFHTTYSRSANTVTWLTAMNRQTVTTIDPVSGRVTQVQPPGVAPIAIHYTGGLPDSVTQGSRVYRLGYDANGRLQILTDPLGAFLGDPARTTTLGYDNADRVTSALLADRNSIVSGYDGNDNQTSLTPPGRTAHLFSYRADDVEKDYIPPAVDANGTGNVHTEWDLERAISSITPSGMPSIVPHFDPVKGRLNSIDYGTRTNTYGYSTTAGQLTSITTPDGVLTYTYDGPLLKSQTWSGGLVTGTVTRTAYDANFWLKAETYGGQTISYDYDNDGLLKLAGALTINRDPITGFVSSNVLASVTDTFAYDPTYGELSDTQATYRSANLLHEHYDVRDALGRIKQKTETVLGEVSHVYQYDYDAVGRLREVVKDCVGSTFPAWSSTASYTAGNCVSYAGFKYRSLVDQSTPNQPDVSATAWDQQHAYAHDANGNRLTAPGITSTPVYDAQDRMFAYGACTYSYKSDGSLQTKTCPDGTTTYDYDSFGNLRHVTLANGTNIDYVIDGQNRRIGRKINGALVEGFLYRSRLQPAAWLNADGSVRAAFVYGLHPNVPEYMVKAGVTYRLITDQLGSVRLVVDSSGAIMERIDYDDFGTVLSDSAPGFQPFAFSGGLRDLDTGLTRFGARDYDPTTGRWTTKDPLRFAGSSTNLYLYCGDDPVNRLDPAGRDFYDWLYRNVPGNFLDIDLHDAANFAAGFGDTLTSFGVGQYFGFSLTDFARRMTGSDDVVNKCSWAYSGGVIAGELWFIAMATNENILTDEFEDSETRSKYFRWGEGPFKHDGETKPRPHFHMWPDMNPHLPWQWQWWFSKW